MAFIRGIRFGQVDKRMDIADKGTDSWKATGLWGTPPLAQVMSLNQSKKGVCSHSSPSVRKLLWPCKAMVLWMWMAPPLVVQCASVPMASRSRGDMSILNTKLQLRQGCIMKKDVAEASGTEWAWLALASWRKPPPQTPVQHVSSSVYLSGHSTKTAEGSLSFPRAGTAFFPSIWTKQLFQSPPGLFTRSWNTSLIDQQLKGKVPWNMLFLLSLVGPSAPSCCSWNILHCKGHHRSPGLWIRLWKGRESQICGHKNSPGGEYHIQGGHLSL